MPSKGESNAAKPAAKSTGKGGSTAAKTEAKPTGKGESNAAKTEATTPTPTPIQPSNELGLEQL